MSEEFPKKPRRVRYKGTHPKAFKEKYKEQNPEMYAADIAKVMEQGRTPAGMHRSICVKEIMNFLSITPGQVGLDATLGYGGHSMEILKALNGEGMLYATDVDPIELPRTTERLRGFGYGEQVFQPRKMNFAGVDRIAAEAGPLNFVLADLGVSSMQIDNPDRGFSFKIDGPLDLRLNPTKGFTAAEILKSISLEELEEVFFEYSDEPYANQIASLIIKKRSAGLAIETTTALKQIILEALSFISPDERKEQVKKGCQRCFQALRIAVNDEFEVLEKFLDRLPDALAEDGRVAILTFHSGEDRRVKKAFQYFHRVGIFSEITTEPIRPSAEECFANPRAKSAKLRWAVKA